MAPWRSDDWLGQVQALVREVLRSDAAEFELQHAAFRLRLKRRPGMAAEALSVAAPASTDEVEGDFAVVAPLTGVFYIAPSPGAPPFARPGDWVAAGSVVGLIEAMKVFNEVVSEHSGVVVSVVAADGELVQAGQRLVLLDTSAPAPAQLEPPRE